MKLRNLTLALALAGVAALSTAAYADDSHTSGFFAGVSGGYNEMKLPENYTDSTNGATTFSSKKYMFGIHGGYLFDMGSGFDIGPSLNINYYGPATATTTENGTADIKDYSIGLQFTGQYTWQSFFARASAGESLFMLRMSPNNSTIPGENQNKWKPVAGLSLGYYFTSNINGSLFYQHVFGSTNEGSTTLQQPQMDSVGLSIEYAFGKMGMGS